MHTTKPFSRLFLFLVVVILLVACAGGGEPESIEAPETVVETVEEEAAEPVEAIGSEDGDGAPIEPGSGPKVQATRVVSEGWVDETASSTVADVAAEPVSEEAAVESVRAAEVEGEAVDAEAPELAPPAEDDAAVDSIETRGEAAETADLTLDQNSRLTAGDVDDNAQWDDYLLYRQTYSGARVLDVDISERHQIFVLDTNGFPVLGARLGIFADGQQVATLRTHSDGRAYFYPSALPASAQAESYEVEVVVDGQIEQFTLESGGSQRVWEITHAAADQLVPEARLDILFLIDATGSMADEINQLKENIRAISARIDAMPTKPNVRFGMTVYRDREDAFVTRTFEFTPDVEFFAQGLAEVEAAGGGDYPEDLNEGLFKAIHVPEWRVENTVSLIFLVADAPPHLDYADQESNYAVEMAEAAERGIKIYPIASSGLDSQGEYIFRQMAQYTGGRFLFLTYGAGGAGTEGTETTFDVDGYDVTSLDGLVIKIVEEELAHLER